MRAAVLAALLLTGCASAPRALTPYTTAEIEGARAECLAADMIWCESQDQARCVARGAGRERATR